MGQPVKILDVANKLIERSGRDIKVVFTGLRPGEKINEALFSANDEVSPTSHPLISKTRVPRKMLSEINQD